MQKKILLIGIFFCLTAVILGAFGAHFFKKFLIETQLNSFETAVRYQFLHGIVLIVFVILNKTYTLDNSGLIQMLFIIGTCFFCFSIYLLVFTKNALFGPITPIGGLLLIIAWAVTFRSIYKNKLIA